MFVTMMLIAALCGTVTATDSAPIPTSVQVDMGPNVDAMLRDLAEQIGVGAEAVYPLYLRQAAIHSTVCVIILCAIALMILAGIPFLWRGFRIDERADDWSEPCGLTVGGSALVILGFVGCLLFAIVAVPGWITAANNPALWAIQHIASDAAMFVK